MNELEIWIGQGTFETGKAQLQYTKVAAVCENIQQMQDMVRRYANLAGVDLIRLSDAAPFFEWSRKAPDDMSLDTLAKAVISSGPIIFEQPLGQLQTPGYLANISLGNVQPLDGQFGIYPPKSVPDALHPAFFGPLDGSPHALELKLYAVIDGALIDALEERFDAEGLVATCLFSDTAKEEYGAVGPWLVELPEGSGFLKSLMSHNDDGETDWTFWQREAALFIRTEQTLAGLAAHLKRFTRVVDPEDPNNRWMMFRFYAPTVMSCYLEGISDWHDRLVRWFYPIKGPRIEAIITPKHDGACKMYRPGPHLRPEAATRLVFTLTDRDRKPLQDHAERQTIASMAADLKRLFSKELVDRSVVAVEASVLHTIKRMRAYGITHAGQLLHFAAWDIFYGHRFELRDRSGGLVSILQSAKPAKHKFEEFKNALTFMYEAR